MILLDRIFSETELFNEVRFRGGVNLIIGTYSDRGPGEEYKGDVNGVGKSTLVRLIDFTLLSDSVLGHFNLKKLNFLKGHTATLQFHSEEKKYKIKRSFDDPKYPYFSEDDEEFARYGIEELRKLLGEIFFLPPVRTESYDPEWYRSLMHFFIKDDLDTHRRFDPINFIHQDTRKFETYSYNQLLMGLPFDSTMNYDTLSQEQYDFRRQKNDSTKRLTEESGMDIKKVNAELVNLERKIGNLQQGINQFKFFNTFEEVDREYLVLGGELTELLSKYRNAKKKLEKYRESYLYDNEVDENKISKLYNEINVVLGDFVKKKLEEVIEFRKELSRNRERYLKKRETELVEQMRGLQVQIDKLENNRSRLLRVLNSKGELNNLKASYEQLISEKTRKERLSLQISEIKEIDKKLNEARTKTSEAITQINRDINDNQAKIDHLISLFEEVTAGAIPDTKEEANFSIWLGNRADSPLTIEVSIPKEDALGHKRFKIVAYDLTLFLNIVQNGYKFPHFLIHDGVYNGIGLKTIIRTLNFIEGAHRRYGNFQYIVTAIEGDAIRSKEERYSFGDYNFDLDDKVIAQYDDSKNGFIFKGRE